MSTTCKFIDCNIAEDCWVECSECGLKLETMSPAHKFNDLGIFCTKSQQSNKLKVYYARPINLYNTPQDARDIELIEQLGLEVVNPNKEVLAERYKKEGMDVFLEAINDCNALAFRSFPDLKISAGVVKEIEKAQELKLPVFELPTITETRCLSVKDTRAYLGYLGQR